VWLNGNLKHLIFKSNNLMWMLYITFGDDI
jgi:hypothetical protein